MSKVSLSNISKSYGKEEIIKNLDLDVADKELLVLVGPSGCGKSTLLRMVAGLEDITVGEISIGDRVVNNLEPRDRNIAFVFQNYALYPHMSVEKNISFGLRAAKMDKAQIKEKVAAAAEILELEELMSRKPAELSGGQRQRVAMGRAMVREPDVFLFDEPLSNLDAKLRASMRLEIKRLHERLKTTIIYVTHDQMEAMTLADRIVILKDGEIQQIGSPMELYSEPVNKFVAGFIGSPEMNFLAGEDGKTMGIRPEDIYLTSQATRMDNAQKITATLQVIEPLGAETLLTCDFQGQRLTVKVPGVAEVTAGAELELVIDGGKVCFFGEDGERV